MGYLPLFFFWRKSKKWFISIPHFIYLSLPTLSLPIFYLRLNILTCLNLHVRMKRALHFSLTAVGGKHNYRFVKHTTHGSGKSVLCYKLSTRLSVEGNDRYTNCIDK